MRKLIDISEKDKMTLNLEAVKEGTTLKPYLEDMISDRVKAVRVANNLAENPLKKKVEKPKPKKEVVKVVEKTITPPKSKFDISGAFKPVEPKIYTNGKCFEVRTWVEGVGVQKTHHESLEEARKSLEK
tara:strand:+ start:512 stop:898 length:387 start_codon:yes stop_codon:yes gene_type:complete